MKLILVFTVLVFTASVVQAQRTGSTVLNVYGGYTFKDKIDFNSFHGYVDEAIQYGGGIEYFPHRTRSVEIKYVRMDTHFPLYTDGGNTQLNEGRDDGAISYLLIGGNNYFGAHSDSKVSPYGGAGLGIGFISVKDGGDATEFAYEFKLGVKVNTTSAVSYKFQAYFQSMIGAVGTDFYYSGGGTVISVPDTKSVNQFGLTAVLSFDFSHAKK